MKMQSPALCLLTVLLAPASAAAEARVTAVVVYPDRAQVTRATAVTCAEGQAPVTVSFTGLPPSTDPASLRAAAIGGTVQGLRFEARPRKEAYSAEWKSLEDAILALERERRGLADERNRHQASTTLAGNYATVTYALIGREMVGPAPDVRAFGGAVEGVLGAQLAASAALTAVAARLDALEPRLADLRRRQADLASARARSEYLAEVMVDCARPSAGQTRVELTYLVGGAGWAPAYEARLDAGIELATFATVTQTTGERWNDARLTLSTAVPRQNATPPEIAPLKVFADERPPPRKVLQSRSELQRHASAPLGASDGGAARLGIADQGTSVQMVLPAPADVAGDGSPARLLVARTRLPGAVSYRSAPKFMPFVFRVAETSNNAPFPLLPGPVDAFRKGDFLGRYGLERTAVGDRFNLTFGVEDAMKVKRVTVEEVHRVEGLLGGMRHHRYEYTIDVGNYLPAAQELTLTEQVPVSELDDVKVVIDNKTSAGYQHNRDDGLITWRVKLAAGEKRQLRLAFRIEVPQSYEQ